MDDLTDVWPADIQYLGGKAANFGFLRREIPANSPAAIALTFDLWEAFLDQIVDLPFDPKPLREQIGEGGFARVFLANDPILDREGRTAGFGRDLRVRG